jgi:hypothetical protein
MTEYTLGSNKMCNTPAVVGWLKQQYRKGDKATKAKLVATLIQGYHLEPHVAKQLLSGKIDYRVEEDKVVFDAEEACDE